MSVLRIAVSVLLLFLFLSSVHANELVPINIAVEFTDHAASAYIAKQKGWFEKEGIKPTFFNYVTGMALASALGRGDIQVAYMCLLPAINAYANAKVPIKIVAGTHEHGYALVVNPEKIKNIKDLERPDITIGAVQVGGPVDAILRKTIEKFRLDDTKILKKVQRMNPPVQIMAIRMGKLDASFVPEHWPSLAEDAGFRVMLKSQDMWPNMQGSVLVVKEELIKNHPEIVKKLIRITAKATDWMKKNKKEAADIMAEQMKITGEKIFPVEAAQVASKLEITPKTMLRSMERLDYKMDIDHKKVEEAVAFAYSNGYIRTKIEAKDILDLRFLNER
ncbi:MAG TPA: ABC transporter substrate-binding protein [Syntrophorhabdaceae bacterium]|nr:ABC transporter substrate-binding protein [Syntrophorhabdaceae bacterium]